MAKVEKRGISKPLSSPGGKEAWRGLLLERVPDHRVYVEPFAGSATLLFAKARSEIEVLADTNADIINVYTFLRDGSDADFEWMREQDFDPSETRFDLLSKAKFRSRRERAYRTKYLNLHGAQGDSTRFHHNSRANGAQFKRHLERYRERLEGVKLFHADAMEVVKRTPAGDNAL